MNTEQLLNQSRLHFTPELEKLLAQPWFQKSYTVSKQHYSNREFNILAKTVIEKKEVIRIYSVAINGAGQMYHQFFHSEESLLSQKSDSLHSSISSRINQIRKAEIGINKERKQIHMFQRVNISLWNQEEHPRPCIEIEFSEPFTSAHRQVLIYPVK